MSQPTLPTTPTGLHRLFRDPAFLVALFATAIAVAGFVWWMSPGRNEADHARPRTLTHMHCPNCHEELPYDRGSVNKKCTACNNPGYYVPTAGSIADRNEESGFGRFVLIALGVLLVGQMFAFFGFARMRTLRERDEQVRRRRLLARCPYCKRKLAFSATLSGTWTACYQCKTSFELPDAEHAELAPEADV